MQHVAKQIKKQSFCKVLKNCLNIEIIFIQNIQKIVSEMHHVAKQIEMQNFLLNFKKCFKY